MGETIVIPKLDYPEFNRYEVQELHRLFESDYVLTVHTDGFILNPDKWKESFRDYDYIGAAWPRSSDFIRESYRVGNGGFCLRSKKLCRAIHNLDYRFGRDGNADQFVCVQKRKELEDQGIKFAPVEVAEEFSQELPTEKAQTVNSSFGFHRYIAGKDVKTL